MDVFGVSAALLQPTIDQLSSGNLQLVISQVTQFLESLLEFSESLLSPFSLGFEPQSVCSLLKGFCLISAYLDTPLLPFEPLYSGGVAEQQKHR